MPNRYLRDRASRRYNSRGMRMGDRAMDGRNPYGSRGGYVVSGRRGRRDREMGDMADYGYDMARGGRGRDRDMARGQDGHYPRQMEYEMYGMGGMRPMDYAQGDYARGGRGRDRAMGDYGYGMDYGNDYGYGMGYDYASEDMEKEWKEDIEEWTKELKKKDKFKLSKEQILQIAKQMNIMFKDFTEEEFVTTYYMMISDYPDVATNHQIYIVMAKDFLEDKDSELKGSEKLCSYYYEIVKGGEE